MKVGSSLTAIALAVLLSFSVTNVGLAASPAIAVAPSILPSSSSVISIAGLYTTCGSPQGGQLLITPVGNGFLQKLRLHPTYPWFIMPQTKVLNPVGLTSLNQQWWAAGNVIWGAESAGSVYTVIFAPNTQPVDLKLSSGRPDVVIHHGDFNTDYCRTVATTD